MNTTLGGDRLGSGNKQKVNMRNYERSTHDLSYIWRSTMSAGTLVPFMSEVGLPGDSFDIGLDTNVLTHPTIGPLFGSYKIQLDVFKVPVRLYQAQLHMNKLGIGLQMDKIKLPQMTLHAQNPQYGDSLDNAQINPSSIFSYLNIRGVGLQNEDTSENDEFYRNFNAIPFLGYWDIFKNYYANKQEEEAFVIHNDLVILEPDINTITIDDGTTSGNIDQSTSTDATVTVSDELELEIVLNENYIDNEFELDRIKFFIGADGNTWIGYQGTNGYFTLTDLFETIDIDGDTIICTGFLNPMGAVIGEGFVWIQWGFDNSINDLNDTEIKLVSFPLTNIDNMRDKLLQWSMDFGSYRINENEEEPYSLPFKKRVVSIQGGVGGGQQTLMYSKQSTQEGLAVKTYQSDLFNNWVSTEWIDGDSGINDISKVTVDEDGSFTIDELNLASKIHRMLMRIGVSGGSYDDWQEAVYTHNAYKRAESPIYLGGLIKELAFQEVISNAEAGEQPLGTLAGRGQMTKKHKGGKVRVKVDEACYIMGIISLTPRLDYSQGNKWDMNLKTMDDFHKPALDEIGFQDLITDQMAWWDTEIPQAGALSQDPKYKSAGKQPAWINYMTNVNQVRGNFAIDTQQMFMILNRRYEDSYDPNTGLRDIKDLTTYIDPSKFNHIFADTRLDAQNFWTQIKVDIKARRKMSAKVIPNL